MPPQQPQQLPISTPTTIPDDLVDLQDGINEDSITSTIRSRFLQDKIFTRIAHPILITVNPYKDVRHFIEDTSNLYFTEYKGNGNGNTPTSPHHHHQHHQHHHYQHQNYSLPPHIFQHINQAYFYMRRTGQDQSIILSGTSGSGKSEMHHWILHHLFTLCTHSNPNANKKKVHYLIDNAHHLIDSFGHTQTLLGSNISKMAKVTSYQFNDRGRMIGAKWTSCVLDTSTTLTTTTPPSNQAYSSNSMNGGSTSDDKIFHIFYYLMYGASDQEKADLHLDYIHQHLHQQHGGSNQYIGNGFLSKNQHKEPRPTQSMIDLYTDRYRQTRRCATSIGITKQTWRQLMRILAAILHLGHIQFTQDPEGVNVTNATSNISNNNSGNYDSDSGKVAAQVKSLGLLDTAADLLGVDPSALENVLIYKTRLVHHDLTTHVLSPQQAYHQRDALCQTLYNQIVAWIIYRVNGRLCSKDQVFNTMNVVDFPGASGSSSSSSSSSNDSVSNNNTAASLSSGSTYSGAVDTFDEFCMTFANEHLHDMLLRQFFDDDPNVLGDTDNDRNVLPALKQQPSSSPCMSLFNDPGFIKAWQGITPSTEHPHQQLGKAFSTIATSSSPKSTIAKAAGKLASTITAKKQATWYHSSDTVLGIQKYTGAYSYYSTYSFGDRLTTQSYADAASLFSPTQCILELGQELFSLESGDNNKSKKRNNKGDATSTAPTIVTEQPHHLRDPCSAILDMIQSIIQPSNTWWVLCLRPNSLSLPQSCDSKTVASQVRYLHLADLANKLKRPSYTSMSFDECALRYAAVLEEEGDDHSNDDPLYLCYTIKDAFAWDQHDFIIMDDQTTVYLSHPTWYTLESMLRNIEKREQKRLKCITKGIPFDDDMTPSCSRNPSCYDMSMDNGSVVSGSCYGHGPGNHMETDSMCPSSYLCGDGNYLNGDMDTDSTYTSTPRQGDNNAHNDNTTVTANSHDGDDNDADNDNNGGEKKSSPQRNQQQSQKRKKQQRQCIKTPSLGVSRSRGIWVCMTWLTTWWLPSFVLHYVGGMRRSDIRMAWREKVTLCFFILLLCAAMVWFIAFFGQLVCPHQDLFTQSELQSKSDKDNAYISIRGEVFDLTSFAPRHWASEVIPASSLYQYAGQDASDLFPVQVSALCEGIHHNQPIPKEVTLAAHVNITDTTASYHDFRYFKADYRPDWYFEQMVYMRKNYRLGFMGYDPVDIQNQASMPVQIGGINTQRQWAILHDHVYDLTSYMKGGRALQYPPGMTPSSSSFASTSGDGSTNMTLDGQQRNGTLFNNNSTTSNGNSTSSLNQHRSTSSSSSGGVNMDFIDNSITELFRQLAGTDISAHFDALPMDAGLRARQLTCMRNLFFVGKVDTRNALQCQLSEYLLLLITAFLCSVILFKFLAAFRLGQHSYVSLPPNQAIDSSAAGAACSGGDNGATATSAAIGDDQFYNDKFIICQVPCYTEGEDSLRKTIDSLAVMKYDDQRKLLFLIADGMIVGSGNDRSTPRIVLDILGVEPDDQMDEEPLPMDFISLGEGQRQHNRAKVYSGLYHCHGHVVPFLVVVKVGTADERQKSGNRGKRDSQMILMRFLNKIHYDLPMTPLELEMHHQLKNVIGVLPSFYELVLMVDADTEVAADALNHMVSSFVRDPKLVGLCGETVLSNEKESWVTMIQVYEYYISHHLAKAFESLFGSVTCLPGCFCMYRVRAATKNQPLLASHQVIADYAENNVNTLHKKNLLHLGEDRYLTTLILKHFPTYKTKFNPDASCRTNAPDQWQVLLSQRRRWINSTIHNLGELMFLPQLCGFCCFSMRFVVMLDLLSTLVMPAVVCYLGYLIYQLCTSTSQVPLMSIITLAGVYGLQAIIFITRRKWEHVGWMIVYILAIPVFSFFIPLYAFWHFDDFSWGNTRIVVGETPSGNNNKKAKKLKDKQQANVFDPSSIPVQRWADHEHQLMHQQWQNELDDVRNEKQSITTRSHRSYNNGGDSKPTLSTDQDKLMMMLMMNSSSNGGGNGVDGGPSEAAIVQEIERLLQEHDLMTLTKKQVRDSLSKTFGVDMTSQRDFINNMIEDILAERESTL
ncbi:chitin synthase-domain-containing protein [Chlamydoabsidia padenii]|nr:chitin synthase-domain-containing protein [Chlamydoabsidia padenii]